MSMDELLTRVCGRVSEMRDADRDIPADYGLFGSLSRRADESYKRLDFALRDYLADTGGILNDMKKLDQRLTHEQVRERDKAPEVSTGSREP